MIFKGENVTMGYADSIEDLINPDENKGILKTGDIVERDEEGYFFIVGRKKRFLKIFGLRISLDEVEMIVKNHFNFECICGGNDDELIINIDNIDFSDAVINYVSTSTGLFHQVIKVQKLVEIKRNETGKIIHT